MRFTVTEEATERIKYEYEIEADSLDHAMQLFREGDYLQRVVTTLDYEIWDHKTKVEAGWPMDLPHNGPDMSNFESFTEV